MMLEKFGRKFVQGAKAEIMEPEKSSVDWAKVIEAGCALLEFGVFAFAMLSGCRSSNQGLYGRTVIVNNYIQR